MTTPTFTDVLRTTVAALQAAHPERLGEIARAHAAIIEGHVVPVDAANGKVLSRNGHAWYAVNGTCDCQAGAFGKPCRHLSAWKLYKHVQKQYETMQESPPAPAPAPEPAPSTGKRTIPAHFLQHIQGRPFITYAGLVQLAHERGLQELRATWTYNDPQLSLAHAVATFPFGTFEDCGDSTPQNAQRVGLHWRRLSLTRAKARCLRDALGIDLCSVEEMD